ncbi:divalent-cation tolerance protein CutA [Xanthobacter sp. KR7-65]|uniref:divalent-cation tolerance protein CutA n=1 Tax=Xanthobacter sp. KR7-65 TaxID=3156612 RepID=UPI0032B378AF
MTHDPAQPCLVYTTFPSLDDAETTGRALVEAGLVACANILPGMVSLYRWEGRTERGDEVVMLLKTTAGHAAAVVEAVRARHPYELPAIVVLPIAGGLPAYLDWIAGEVGGTGA